jgi:hypothetical protein
MSTLTFTNPGSSPVDPGERLLSLPLASGLLSGVPATGFGLSLNASAPGSATVQAWAYVRAPYGVLQAMGLAGTDALYRPATDSLGNVYAWVRTYSGTIAPGGSVTVAAIDSRLTPLPIGVVLNSVENFPRPMTVHDGLSKVAIAAHPGLSIVPDGTVVQGEPSYAVSYGDPIVWMVTMTSAVGTYPFSASF